MELSIDAIIRSLDDLAKRPNTGLLDVLILTEAILILQDQQSIIKEYEDTMRSYEDTIYSYEERARYERRD